MNEHKARKVYARKLVQAVSAHKQPHAARLASGSTYDTVIDSIYDVGKGTHRDGEDGMSASAAEAAKLSSAFSQDRNSQTLLVFTMPYHPFVS